MPRQAVEAVVRQVVATLQLPQANPYIGPDPSWNEWNMAVVGHPIWLWTEGPATLATSNSAYGIAVSLDARLTGTVFTMGDGTSVTCARTQPYVRGQVDPGAPSPVCGHTYQQAPRSGSHTVTATAHWSVAWTAAGLSGTLPTTMSASRVVPVGELQALVTLPQTRKADS
ncbi:MAG: hypothetical protein ACLGHZ_07875 [Actinomycetes bacterium]